MMLIRNDSRLTSIDIYGSLMDDVILCRLGEMSPTTSRVRCYCKPSWEGMLSMRPYISDIY